MRCHTPPPYSEQPCFLPTRAHDLSANAASLLSQYDQIYDSDPAVDAAESPLICYMPQIMATNSIIPTTKSDRDGDMTPPLHPKPTVQIVSPGGALPEELTLAARYRSSFSSTAGAASSKRKRAASHPTITGFRDPRLAKNTQKVADAACSTTTTFLDNLMQRSVQHRRRRRPVIRMSVQDLPKLPPLSTILSSHDLARMAPIMTQPTAGL